MSGRTFRHIAQRARFEAMQPRPADERQALDAAIDQANRESTGAGEPRLPARARLLAAAPAMLAKLCDLAGECAECDGNGILPMDGGHGAWRQCPACADIRAVIEVAR